MYFFIAFILYTFLDFAWIGFIKGVNTSNPKLAGISSSLITFIVFIVGWLVYTEKSIFGLIGGILGSYAGAYVGCMKFKEKESDN